MIPEWAKPLNQAPVVPEWAKPLGTDTAQQAGGFDPSVEAQRIRSLPLAQQQLAFGALMQGLDEDSRAAVVEQMMQTQPTGEPVQPQLQPKPRTVPAYSKPVDPTEGMSPLQLGLAGMGKAFVDIGSGVGQIGRQVLPESWSNTLGLPTQAEVDANKKLDEPLMRTKSGIVGNIAGKMAMIAPTALVPGVNTYTGAAATGGLLNALQPMETGQSRGKEAAIGAAVGLLGQGMGNALGRVFKPIRIDMPAVERGLVSEAKALGLPLNVAQSTGSKPWMYIDSALDNMPFTSGSQAALKGSQRDLWQRAVLREIGENADTAKPDVIGSAYTRIGQQFEDLASRNTVDLGQDFLNAVVGIDQSITPFSRGIKSVVDDALELAQKGRISGSEYQKVRSSLSQAARGSWENNPELGQALKSLRTALDDSASASMSPQDRGAWEMAHSQYKNLRSIEKAVDPTTGIISPKKYINELRRANPKDMMQGTGDQTMPTLAKVGKQFIADNLPDSGTAQRAFYMKLLQPGVGGLLGYTIGGDRESALMGATAGVIPLAAQKALWGNGRYLTKGLLDPVTTNAVTRALGIPTMLQVPALLE